jgi:hypothetical protein
VATGPEEFFFRAFLFFQLLDKNYFYSERLLTIIDYVWNYQEFPVTFPILFFYNALHGYMMVVFDPLFLNRRLYSEPLY